MLKYYSNIYAMFLYLYSLNIIRIFKHALFIRKPPLVFQQSARYKVAQQPSQGYAPKEATLLSSIFLHF